MESNENSNNGAGVLIPLWLTPVLLGGILLVLIGMLTTQINFVNAQKPSEDCTKAKLSVKAHILSRSSLYSDYENAAYTRADNIYQQIFSTGEYNFLSLQQLTSQQDDLLLLMSACN